ncbi:MAG: type II toxin-antitoxin system HicB family antitoxin [Nanoarchaeota archaeon]|nr:type II toxin-antitoxin system HicB family antitoxin [Nanoarchaeota archaeon]
MVNINITIPDELHKKLKVEAAIQEITLKELVISVAERESQKKHKIDSILKK